MHESAAARCCGRSKSAAAATSRLHRGCGGGGATGRGGDGERGDLPPACRRLPPAAERRRRRPRCRAPPARCAAASNERATAGTKISRTPHPWRKLGRREFASGFAWHRDEQDRQTDIQEATRSTIRAGGEARNHQGAAEVPPPGLHRCGALRAFDPTELGALAGHDGAAEPRGAHLHDRPDAPPPDGFSAYSSKAAKVSRVKIATSSRCASACERPFCSAAQSICQLMAPVAITRGESGPRRRRRRPAACRGAMHGAIAPPQLRPTAPSLRCAGSVLAAPVDAKAAGRAPRAARRPRG